MQAVRALKAVRSRRTTASWRSLKDACGVVQIGGDAIEDTQALYDG
jgi:hypothetical protein